MKNSLLKIYTLVVAIIFAGTLLYFGGALAYEYYNANLDAYTIYFYAKICFCIIAFFTALTILMICLVAKYGIQDTEADLIEEIKNKTSDSKVTAVDSEETSVSIEEAAQEFNLEEPVDDADVYIEDSEKESLVVTEENIADEENPPVYSDEDIQAVLPVQKGVPGIPVEENESIPKIPIESPSPVSDESTNFDGTQSKGLFDSTTGLGWESYLLTRLENELVRATASEYDLVCYVIKLGNIQRESEKSKVICTYLADEFQFKDLLFEYKDDSIVAIRTNFSIDEAIVFAEKISSHIEGMLDEGENCWIGISSRTIRMVSAERLLKEADQAVLHAIDDEDSNIIAFRVNAEKYMQMMESRKD